MWWSIAVSLLWSGIKALFGKSDKEKLGIAETLVEQQAKTIKELTDAQEIDREHTGVTDDELRHTTGRWLRPDTRCVSGIKADHV